MRPAQEGQGRGKQGSEGRITTYTHENSIRKPITLYANFTNSELNLRTYLPSHFCSVGRAVFPQEALVCFTFAQHMFGFQG